MLNDQELKTIILKDSVPKLSDDFYGRIERSVKSTSSPIVGDVLAWQDYLLKPQILILVMLAIIATVTLLNVSTVHSDDDLTKVDALSFSSSLTL